MRSPLVVADVFQPLSPSAQVAPEGGSCPKGKGSGGGDFQCSPEDADLMKMSWRLDTSGYAIRGSGHRGKHIYMHHVVCLRIFGRRADWAKREVTDHINRDRLDNRRENLRIVSIGDNIRNRDFGTGAFITASGKWNAQFKWKLKRYRVGLYPTATEAAQAVAEARARVVAGLSFKEAQP